MSQLSIRNFGKVPDGFTPYQRDFLAWVKESIEILSGAKRSQSDSAVIPGNKAVTFGDLSTSDLHALLALAQADVSGLTITEGPTFDHLHLTGGQIAFPATQNASADAHTLDDYEEGTWTPDLQFGSAKVGLTYSNNNGLYTRIGNIVKAN